MMAAGFAQGKCSSVRDSGSGNNSCQEDCVAASLYVGHQPLESDLSYPPREIEPVNMLVSPRGSSISTERRRLSISNSETRYIYTADIASLLLVNRSCQLINVELRTRMLLKTESARH